MGNQNTQISNDRFRKEDWEPVQKLPDSQVWQNRREPSFRIQQYQITTQNEAELLNQKKMYNLRRKNPFLVAACYFESHARDEFCSTQSIQSLYLQRIPIRLNDVEHIPFPDCLHLYDSCLKGFAQLSRFLGYFLVDQAMIGINQRGKVKIWCNQDFSKSFVFGPSVNEENMVRNLINVIDRCVDFEQLSSSIPMVRNFLYKNTDSLNFPTAIWQFGEFVKQFNGGKVPDKLSCVDKVGGVYAIANRQRYSKDMEPNLPIQLSNGASINHIKKVNDTQQYRISPIQRPTIDPSLLQSPRQSYSQQKVNFITPKPVASIVINQNINKPTEIVKQSQVFHHKPNIFFTHSPPSIKINPQSPPRIVIQKPIFQTHTSIPQFSKFIPNLQSNNHQNIASFSPINKDHFRISSPPKNIKQYHHTFTSVNSLPIHPNHIKQSHIIQPKIQHHYRPSNGLSPLAFKTRTPPKFTVEVIPGKVFPKNNSNFAKQLNSSNQRKKQVNKKMAVLFQKKRAQKNAQSSSTALNIPKVQQQQTKQETKAVILQKANLPALQDKIEQKILVRNIVQEKKESLNELDEINAVKMTNLQQLSKKGVFTTSYEVQEQIEKVNKIEKQSQAPQVRQDTQYQEVRQNRNSLWTAGSKSSGDSIDYEQMERRLAISFNPNLQQNTKVSHQAHQNLQPNNTSQQKELIFPSQAIHSNTFNSHYQYQPYKPFQNFQYNTQPQMLLKNVCSNTNDEKTSPDFFEKLQSSYSNNRPFQIPSQHLGNELTEHRYIKNFQYK